MSEEIEKAVTEILESAGVKFTIEGAGAGLMRDGWECDGWRVTLGKPGGIGPAPDYKKYPALSESFDYYTGTGHRKAPEKLTLKWIKDRYGARYMQSQEYKSACKPKAPHIAGVMYSLCLESSAIDESFIHWCENFGYDSDSLKALNTYNDCCAIAGKLARIFSRDVLAKLREALQDY